MLQLKQQISRDPPSLGGLDPRLAQLTALASEAQTAAELDAVGLQRVALIVEHCKAAGLSRVARFSSSMAGPS